VLASALLYGRNNGKAVYVFSVDREGGKVAHSNFVPKEILSQKKIDGKKWLGAVSQIVGGKASFVCDAMRVKYSFD
jgi:alanyl-tRNA synthetase